MRLEGGAARPNSGLSEFGINRAQVGNSRLAILRDAQLCCAPQDEGGINGQGADKTNALQEA